MVGGDSVGRGEVRRGQHLFAVRVRVASYLVYPPFPEAVVDLLSEGPREVASGVVLDMGVPSLHPSAAFLGAIRVRQGRLQGAV